MLRIVILIQLLIVCALTPASAGESRALVKFVGDWSCQGSFASNGAPIAANLSIRRDERSGAWILRHDDIPPGAYHSLEVWMMNKAGAGARAAISDKYAGMRWFESPGWVDNTLTWTRLENGIAAEQFAYAYKGNTLQVEWSIARSGAMELGDTLVCRRTAPK
jgi:hypothetical protein